MVRRATQYFAVVLLLGGCGYHVGPPAYKQQLSVPYIAGDVRGDLTSQVIYGIESSGMGCYVDSNGRYELQVEITDNKFLDVDYRRDPEEKKDPGSLKIPQDLKKDGLPRASHDKKKKKRSLIPSETRQTLIACVSIIDTCECCTVYGPIEVTANVTFDHEYNVSTRDMTKATFGQLTNYDEAREAAMRPLHRRLAQEIVDVVIAPWVIKNNCE